jgi:flagellin
LAVIINTNIPALLAMNALDGTETATQSVLQQLSTGYRITSAAVDPAGLAIATEMNAQVGGLNQAYSNAQSANSMLQTAEGGIGQDQQILQQIRSLAVEASNGTMTSTDRQNIQSEINQLIQQINDNAKNTVFNNKQLLNGNYSQVTATTASSSIAVTVGSDTSTVGTAAAGTYTVKFSTASGTNGEINDIATLSFGGATIATATLTNVTGSTASLVFQFVGAQVSGSNLSFNLSTSAAEASTSGATATFTVASDASISNVLSFQVGANQGGSNELNVTLGNMNAKNLGLQDSAGNNLDVSTSAAAAQNAITIVNNAINMQSTARSNVGAYENQLSYTMTNLQTESTNLNSAQSDIMDVNMAQAMTSFTKDQVLAQSGAAMLSQAQALPDLILKILG